MPLAWTNQYYGEACTDRQNCKDSPYPEYAVISCFRCICLLFCWLSYIFRRTGGLFRRRCRFFSRIAGFRSIRRLARICRLAGIRLFSIRIATIDRSDWQRAAGHTVTETIHRTLPIYCVRCIGNGKAFVICSSIYTGSRQDMDNSRG